MRAEILPTTRGLVIVIDRLGIRARNGERLVEIIGKDQGHSLGRWRWALMALTCMLVGTAAGWALRERPLLAPDSGVETIGRQETAESQYIYASMLGTEEAWKEAEKTDLQTALKGRA